jgi:DNA-binding response OmpR family regulator
MKGRVLIFEDNVEHALFFKGEFEKAGCEVAICHHLEISDESLVNTLTEFQPSHAVVDSHFDGDLDGVEVVRFLVGLFGNVSIVICTVLCDNPEKKEWVVDRYDLPNVLGVIGKKNLPDFKVFSSYFEDLL